MKQISISEEQFATTQRKYQLRILDLAREFAENSGIDWEFQYRFMIMTEENYFLAQLKYNDIIRHMTVRTI